MLAPVLEALRAEPEAAMASLAERFPQMNTEALEVLLRRLLFVSAVWGRVSEDSQPRFGN
jgi:phage gp29-like protein